MEVKKMETGKGIITSIITTKGYGFITAQDNGELIFFHAMGVCEPKFEDIREGQPVEYMLKETPKGKLAIGVVVI